MDLLEGLDQYHPYSLDAESKNQILGEILFGLEKKHIEKCQEYKLISKGWKFSDVNNQKIEND